MSHPPNITVYLPADIRAEIRAEAKRQDRSFSWVVQMAWQLARERIQSFPTPWRAT